MLTPHYGAHIGTAATCVVVRRLVNQLLSSLGDALTAAKQVRPLPLEDWVLRKDEMNELRDVTVTELHACRFARLSYPHTIHEDLSVRLASFSDNVQPLRPGQRLAPPVATSNGKQDVMYMCIKLR